VTTIPERMSSILDGNKRSLQEIKTIADNTLRVAEQWQQLLPDDIDVSDDSDIAEKITFVIFHLYNFRRRLARMIVERSQAPSESEDSEADEEEDSDFSDN